MPVTLAQYQVGLSNKVDHFIIDKIRRTSLLMDKMTFIDAVTPEGGSTLTYGYTMLKTPGTAGGRALNAEYTAKEAEKELKTAALVIMGGSYQIDRVLASNAPAAASEVAFQNEEKAKATASRFQYLAINGKSNVDTEFDGLDAILASTSNDFTADEIDVSTSIDTMAKAQAICEGLDTAIANIIDKENVVIIANTKSINKMKAAARILGYLTHSEDAFGKSVEGYNDYPFLDLGEYYNGTATVDVVPVTSGTSKVYVVSLGRTGFVGITPKGGVGITSRLPDFSTAGAVKDGDVEMVACAVLKNTRNASVLKLKLASA